MSVKRFGGGTQDVTLLIACDLEDTINEEWEYMGATTLCVKILSKSTCSKDITVLLFIVAKG